VITDYQHSGYEYFTKSKLLELAIELRDNPGLHTEPYFSTKLEELKKAFYQKISNGKVP